MAGTFYLVELINAIVNARFQAAARLLELGIKTGLGLAKIGDRRDER